MKSRSDRHDAPDTESELRAKIIGLGERSARKSHYPELRARIAELERFRAALDGSHEAILLGQLPGGKLQDVNEAACRMLHVARDELIGRPLGEVFPTLRPHLERLAVRTDGYREIIEMGLPIGAAAELPVEMTLNAVRIGGDRYAVVVARDVTERRRVQWTLQFLAASGAAVLRSLDRETMLENLAQVALPDLGDVCVVYARGHSGAIRQLAASHADARGVMAARALEERHREAACVERFVARAMTSGRAELIADVADAALAASPEDAAYLAALSELGFSSVLAVPYYAGPRTSGALLFGVVGSGRSYDSLDLDVARQLAQRVAMALENARLYADAQEASRLKDDFLAIVSHELRTPLTAILGWANLLVVRQVGEIDFTRAVTSIERNARALGVIIDDLLDVSRMIANKLDVALSPLSLAPLVAAAADASRPAIDAKQLSFEVSIAHDLPPVLGDARRLSQVVSNLLTNAIKFTPTSGRVELILGRREDRAEIVVRDTGCGIRPDFLQYIFEPFRQTQGALARGRAGLGLGLAIVRHIVELHDGEVRAESPGEGLGACFVVSLPFARR